MGKRKSEQEKLLDKISAILKEGGKTYEIIAEIEEAMIKSSGSSFSQRTSEANGEQVLSDILWGIYYRYDERFGGRSADAHSKAEAFDELLEEIHKLSLGEGKQPSDVNALVIPKITDDFEADKLHLVFTNLRKINRNFLGGHGYIMVDEHTGNEIAELCVLGEDEREWRFCVDNYPGQRKYYSTNLPYETFEDFMIDLKRINLELLAAQEAV